MEQRYNLYHEKVKINNHPLTLKEAENQRGLCIINYGYRPDIVSAVTEPLYNLYRLGVKLNSQLLTLKEAEDRQGLCIINHGYRPDIVPA